MGGLKHTFWRQPFAPPSGQTAINYARYMHNEKNGTIYLPIWTTSRLYGNGTASFEVGANFYIAQYHIRVQQAVDSCIIFRPKDIHGTSLMANSGCFEQIVLSFAISNRLESIWKKYHEGLISKKEMDVIVVNDQESCFDLEKQAD
ncbi:hypothetical protein BDZ91DRAFT_437903 [Kalaharituber pfeilii]|nr:hypothetical protein BDZ91DRAFT_437903 [Kalaharituber pfeilii]